jgi:hypothetical protein
MLLTNVSLTALPLWAVPKCQAGTPDLDDAQLLDPEWMRGSKLGIPHRDHFHSTESGRLPSAQDYSCSINQSELPF